MRGTCLRLGCLPRHRRSRRGPVRSHGRLTRLRLVRLGSGWDAPDVGYRVEEA